MTLILLAPLLIPLNATGNHPARLLTKNRPESGQSIRFLPKRARPGARVFLATTLVSVLSSLMTLNSVAENREDNALETVLVTATRNPAPAYDLPVAWSAIDSDTVGFTAPQHANQLFQRAAGTWISRGNGQESLIAVRSPVLTGAGSCGTFVTAADGVPLRAPGFCNVNQLFDANLAQAGAVEVIRGPGTAVYGSNAMHGVINVLSAGADTTSNAIRVETGSRDFYRVLAGIALPNANSAINVQASHYGGYQDASGYNQQKLTLRTDAEVGGWDLTGILEGSNLNQETAGYIQGKDSYQDEDLRTENPNPEAYRDAWSLRAQMTAIRDLGDGLSLRLTPYWRNNKMDFLQHYLIWQPAERNGHQSVGLQSSLLGSGEVFSWQIGADVDYTEGWLIEDQAEPFSPNQPAGIHYDYQVKAQLAGAFAQGRLRLADHWWLDVGSRLEQTDYDYDNRTGDGPACEPDAPACRFYRPADRSDSFSDWSGNIALSWNAGPALLYTRLARGFRAPQTAELYRLQSGQTVADIDSEQIDSIELGIRGTLTEGFSYSVNLYRMKKDNVIFQDADRYNVSGAKTDHDGLELELNWQISDVWYAELVANYAEHIYANSPNLLGVREDIEGNLIDTAPKHFGSARLGADTRVGIHPVRAELEWIWLDQYYLEPTNSHRYDGHKLLNLRVDWTITPKLKASLVATNLADEGYAERADFGFGSYRYFVGEPRSAVLGLTWSLD